MNNDYRIENRKKEINNLIDQFDNELHLKMIIEILKSMLTLIRKGELRD